MKFVVTVRQNHKKPKVSATTLPEISIVTLKQLWEAEHMLNTLLQFDPTGLRVNFNVEED